MKYHILHIEDSKTDADLIKRLIQKSGMEFSYHLASDKEEVADALTLFDPNIVLCDHSLPAFNSKMAYKLCKEKNPFLPFILVTGSISEEFAVDMIKTGVDDYLLKTNLQRLPLAIENAVYKREHERKLQALRAELYNSETNLRTFFENASIGLILLDGNCIILELNNQTKYYSKISFGCELLKNENLLDFVPVYRKEELRTQFQKSLQGEKIQYESVYPQQDGSVITFDVKLIPTIHSDGSVAGICIRLEDISERKKATQEITNANELLKLLTENISDMVALHSPDCEYIYVSPSSEKILGYMPEELIGTSTFSLMHPEDLDRVKSGIHKSVLRGDKDQISEYRLKHKNGEYIWIEAKATPVYENDQPEVAKIQSTIRDISARKKAEQETRQLTERLLLAKQCAQLGIWEWNIETNVLIWDEGMYKIYNIAPNEFTSVYEAWTARLHKDDRQRVQTDIQLAIANKKEYQPEFRILWDDATIHYINSTGIIERDADGNAIRMIGINRDVTSQKEREQQLKLLESVVTNTTDSVVITEAEPFDEPGPKIVYVNEAFTKMTGYSIAEVMGKTPRILQGPKSNKAALKNFSERIRKWQTSEITILNYKKNGEEFWNNFIVSPVANEKGWFTHWISIERDVTKSKLAEIERAKITEDLIQRNRDLEQFTFIISHNLRAPTANIMGFAEFLQAETLSPEEQRECLKALATSVLGLDNVIKDINQILQIKNELKEKKEIILLSKLVNDIVEGIGNLIDKDNIHIISDFSEVVEIFSIKAYMHSIFFNLITNSIKYCTPGEPARIEIKSKNENGKTILTFKDNGLGIDMNRNSGKVFGLYERFHAHVEGKGIGLFMVKTQVEAIGGKITIASELNKGTEITITFKK
ncbi:PAS domain S-box protein [Flavobacterium sp.]|uniref:PAS domain S-box protein n=1 Tax=Flavobacterium sp. TaxID=239 RepID=UPI00286ADCAA|nr:PAS domain S-box protein [Flavobacterium sp.]